MEKSLAALLLIILVGCKSESKSIGPKIESRYVVTNVEPAGDCLNVTFRRCVYFDGVLRFKYEGYVDRMPNYDARE